MANKEKLLNIVTGSDNELLKELRERKQNRAWLRRSKSIAIIILSQIEKQNLTQKQLAEKMNVSPQAVNKWVKGKEKLNIETIEKISSALNIDMWEAVVSLRTKVDSCNPVSSVTAPSPKVTKEIPLYGFNSNEATSVG